MKQRLLFEKTMLVVFGFGGAALVIWAFATLLTGCQEAKQPPVVVTKDTAWFCTPIAPMLQKEDRAVGQLGKFWQPGQTIKIGFMGGNDTQKSAVKAAYAEWAESANLKFEYPAAAPYNIRVAFASGSAWSYIGVDANSVSSTYPTLNYGFGGSSVIEHEAGHSLGLLHEQQLAGGVCWNEANVIADLSGPPNNWSIATIRFNVLDYHNPANIITSGYDQASIMHYAIPARWTCNNTAIAGGTKITDLDRAFIAARYPGVTTPPTTGTVTISQAKRDEIVGLQTLAKVYQDSALKVMKKATGL